MIYLKNIREKQTVYIPRTEINGKVVAVKSYDEGYADGKEEGKKLQKSKLTSLTVSENGVYKREDGWNEVEVDVPEIVFEAQEKNITVSKDITVVQPDGGYDVLTKVTVNATQYGQDKRNEGYEDGYNTGNQIGYADGKTDGYVEGKVEGISEQKSKLTNLSVTTNGTYERTDGWNKIDVNVPSQTYNLQQKNITITKDIEEVFPDNGYDALTKVDIDATEFGNQKHLEGYNEGYDIGKVDGREDVNLFDFEVTPSWEKKDENNRVRFNASEYSADGFSSVTIDIGTVYSEGHLQGKTEGYEYGKADGIEEGYNQGYADGKTEGGDITLTPLIDTPMWEFRNPDNNMTYNPSDYNADGFSTVSIKVDVLYNQGKSEGVEEGYQSGYSQGKKDGYDEGYDIGKVDGREDVNLIEFETAPSWDKKDENNRVKCYASEYGADGFSSVIIDIGAVYEEGHLLGKTEGYNEGYDAGKKELKINLENEGVKLSNCSFTVVPEWADFSGITDMTNMFKECSNLTVIPSIDTSLVTRMDMTFENCIGITTIPQLNTSKVTSMFHTFYKCTRLKSIPQLNTSEVTDMSGMLRDCTNLTSIPALNASNVTDISNFLGVFTFDKLTDVGGLTDLKASMDDSFGFAKAPNLTYQSCINILNGLYDFTGNNQTPTSLQGKLKVHQNFLDLVRNQITIATNKGWIITA